LLLKNFISTLHFCSVLKSFEIKIRKELKKMAKSLVKTAFLELVFKVWLKSFYEVGLK